MAGFINTRRGCSCRNEGEMNESVWKRLWKRLDTRLCLIVAALYAVAAIYGECSYRYWKQADRTPPYNEVHEETRYVPPLFTRWFSSEKRELPPGTPLYVLGSDNLGRDVALRLIQGTRIAFHVGVVTSLIAIPLGVLLGCLAGYFRGKVDAVVTWLCATVASMPGLLFILAISMVAGQGLLGIYLGIGLTTWVSVCRNIRGEMLKHRDRVYVQAARAAGFGPCRIMFRHILPNISYLILVAFSVRFPASVATEVFISFLGIGVHGEPSWGIMINNARLRLWQGVWWEMTFVTLAIFVLVLVFNHLADVLRDLLDPALRNER